jgi:hypothetical protein
MQWSSSKSFNKKRPRIRKRENGRKEIIESDDQWAVEKDSLRISNIRSTIIFLPTAVGACKETSLIAFNSRIHKPLSRMNIRSERSPG